MVVHAAVAALAPRHEVTLVTLAGPEPADWEAIERLRASGVEAYAARRPERSGIARWRQRTRMGGAWLVSGSPKRTVWFRESGVQRIIDRLLAERRFDVVQVEDNAMGIYHYRTRAPKLLTEYEVRRPRPVDWSGLLPAHGLGGALNEIDWHRWSRYQQAVWRRFDLIQVFSARDATAVRTIAPDLAGRIRINPFGIDLPPEADRGREEDGTVLFVGNFMHPPNVDAARWLATEIMPLLRERRPGVRLTIVGSDPRHLVRALAAADILVTGFVPEIEPILERAAVVLAPVRTGGGQRMKVLHGMACGKAVVTTARGADGLAIAGERPPLAIADDAGGIAAATAMLLASRGARHELGARARAFVREHYSTRAYGRRLEAIHAELRAREATLP